MALQYIRCLHNRNAVNLMRSLCPAISKSFSSTDKSQLISSDVNVFDNKLDKHMKEKVLDLPTHTGQTFTADDYRLAQFVDKEKQINPRFAIDLIASEPAIACKDRWVSCDGGGGPLGHPKVFINLDDPGEYGTCGYCGLRFYKEAHSHH